MSTASGTLPMTHNQCQCNCYCIGTPMVFTWVRRNSSADNGMNKNGKQYMSLYSEMSTRCRKANPYPSTHTTPYFNAIWRMINKPSKDEDFCPVLQISYSFQNATQKHDIIFSPIYPNNLKLLTEDYKAKYSLIIIGCKIMIRDILPELEP